MFFPAVSADDPGVKDMFNQILAQLAGLSAQVGQLTEQLKSTSDRLEKAEERIAELEEEVNARERHSRSWSVRMQNCYPEKLNEDSEKIVRQIFESIPEVKERQIQFDIVHRVGRKMTNVGSSSSNQTGEKQRAFLIRMLRKADTRFLLQRWIREKFYEKGFPIFQDMTQTDLQEKQKYAREMQELWKQGQKVRFENGHWLVNNKRYIPKGSG